MEAELDERGLTQRAFADTIGIQYSHLNEFIKGKRSMSPTLALKLEKALGIPAQGWMRIQADYNLSRANKSEAAMQTKPSINAYDFTNRQTHDLKISVITYEESGDTVAYTPAFGLTAKGRSWNEAVSVLYADFQKTVEASIGNGTFEAEMTAKGWSRSRGAYVEPGFKKMLRHDKVLEEIVSKREFKRRFLPVEIRA